MKITWIGHSCFKIEKGNYSIVIDPYEDGSVPGLAPVRETANQVLCSHEHGDHNARKLVTITESQDCPFTITKLESYHDDVKGAKRGPNTIHIFDDGETRVAHLGDFGCEPEPAQIEQLRNLDVLLIPVGGFYTMDVREAAEFAEQMEPKIIVPMHYRSKIDGFGFDVLGPVSEFSERMEDSLMMPVSQIDSAAEYDAQVLILQPKNMK